MNAYNYFGYIIIPCIILIIFIFIHARKLNKNDPSKSQERFTFSWNFVKWLIGYVIVYLLVTIIHEGLEEREMSIEEMKQYDNYVNNVLVTKDGNAKKTYALYYSIITPDSDLRKRWRDYYDTLQLNLDSAAVYNDSLAKPNLSPQLKHDLQRKINNVQTKISSVPILSNTNISQTDTFAKIDFDIQDITKLYGYPLVVSLYDGGSPVLMKRFEIADVKKITGTGNSGDFEIKTNFTKAQLFEKSVHLWIPVQPQNGQETLVVNIGVSILLPNQYPIVFRKDFHLIPGINEMSTFVSLDQFLR